jgi:RND family efflux transporter MFP subunit
MRQYTQFTFAAVAVALAIGSGCSKPSVEQVATKAASPVTTLTLAPQTLDGIVTASGTVAAAPGADLTVTAPEPARILEIPKAEGDRVKAGDLLVRFEIPSLHTDVATRRADAESAHARVDNAQANVTRLTTLVEHGVAAQKDLEDARRDLAEARAAVGQAEAALANASQLESRTVVRARFAGVVARRAHNPGDMVEASASDVILRVIDPAKLQVVAAVAIADLARVQVGRPARVLVPGAEEPEEGTVLTRPAAVEPTGVSADVRIALKGTTRLAAGSPVRVEIVAERREGALAVPLTALLHEDENVFVMVAGADNKAHKRKVTVGLSTPALAELTSGVKAGDAVIVQGQQELPDNADIAIAK